MKNIRPEDLGDMGESFFKNLCKSAGLIANNSDDDKGGWDYVVEHPKDNTIDYSNRSYPVYRVQVKSTQSEENKVQITYSNLLKLIEYSGASFILLVKYSGKINPEQAFLLHIDEDFSKRILVEIREKELKNTDFLLHKYKKSINFIDAYEIDPEDGNSLVAALKNSIGSDYLSYTEEKISYLSKLEREGRGKEATLILHDEADIRAMVNCFLGYNEEFRVDMQSYNSPFGIRDSQPIDSNKNFQTKIIPLKENLKKAKIFIKHTKFGKLFEFSGTLFHVPVELPKGVQKGRFKTVLFDFMYSPYGDEASLDFLDVKYIFDENIKVKFKELYNYFCILKGIQNNSSLYIKMENSNGNMSPEFNLTLSEIKPLDDFSNLFIGIEAAYMKASALNMGEEFISTVENKDNFFSFSLIGKECKSECIFEFKAADASRYFNQKANVVILHSIIKFNKKTILCISAFYGSVEKSGENIFRGYFNKSEILGDYVLNSADDLEKITKEEVEKYKEKLSKEGLIVF